MELPASNAKVIPHSEVKEMLGLLDDVMSCDQCEACDDALSRIRNILKNAEDTYADDLPEASA